MTSKTEKVKIWVVSGPCREYDETWLPYNDGAGEQFGKMLEYAHEWAEEACDAMEEGEVVTISYEIREVSKWECDEIMAWDDV